jgi:hypothetical protein
VCAGGWAGRDSWSQQEGKIQGRQLGGQEGVFAKAAALVDGGSVGSGGCRQACSE